MNSGVEHAQREAVDRDILTFVRESARMAPVTVDSIVSFVRDVRRRKLAESDVSDRVSYLVSAGYLLERKEWNPGVGELVHYGITADGMDVMDGVKPPRGWQGK